MAKEQPLWHKIHFDEVYTEIVRLVTYVGLTYRDFAPRLQELIQKYGQKAEAAAVHLVTYEGQFTCNPQALAHVELRTDVRKLCPQILGLPPEHPWYELVQKPEPLPNLWDRPVREVPPPKDQGTANQREEPRQEEPTAQEPTREEPAKEEKPPAKEEETPEEAEDPTLSEPGISPEGYATMAKEKNKRSLFCMLRDARRKLKHHGKRSFMGKEAKKEIAAAEAEIRRRSLSIPPEGEETAPWDKKK
jgi:hypothetical protein